MALQIDDTSATCAQEDRVIACTAFGVEHNVIDHATGIELVVACAQIHHHLFDIVELLDKAHELHVHIARIFATEHPTLGTILNVQVQTLSGTRAGKEVQSPLSIHRAQHRLDGRRQDLDLGQLEAEHLDVETERQRPNTELAPHIAVEVRRHADVEHIQRPPWQARDGSWVGQH